MGDFNKERTHESFFQAIGELLKENKHFRDTVSLKLIGKVDHGVTELVEKYHLNEIISIGKSVSHSEAIEEMIAADLLYLPTNNSSYAKMNVPGKTFEYLRSGTPVIGTGLIDGEAADIFKEVGLGKMFDFYDTEGIKKEIIRVMDLQNALIITM